LRPALDEDSAEQCAAEQHGAEDHQPNRQTNTAPMIVCILTTTPGLDLAPPPQMGDTGGAGLGEGFSGDEARPAWRLFSPVFEDSAVTGSSG